MYRAAAWVEPQVLRTLGGILVSCCKRRHLLRSAIILPDWDGIDWQVNVTEIQSHKGWSGLELAQLWDYRELIWLLAWRDISSRYKQTVLGIFWAILQPLGSVIVLSVVLGRMVKVPSDGIPYPLFAFSAVLCWQYVATVAGASTATISSSSQLITKVFFPRLVLPISIVIPPLVDLGVSLSLLLVSLPFFHVSFTLGTIWLPYYIVLLIITALSVSCWFSGLAIAFHDMRHVFPLLMQLWMFSSPIFYPMSLVPQEWRLIYSLNPMSGILEGLRYCLLGAPPPVFEHVCASTVSAVVLLITGALFFKRLSKIIADLI